jgi:dienelactone hydrolase
VKAKILVAHGAADQFVPDADLAAFEQEMKDAKSDYRIAKYAGALHGFTNPGADAKGKQFGIPLAYQKAADEQSWKDMQDLFKTALA